MKKLILFFCCLMVPFSVKAADNISYSEWQTFREESLYSQEESELRYRWYLLKEIDLGYSMNKIADNYYADDYLIEESSWQENSIENLEGRVIEEKTIYQYKKLKSVRYITIHNIFGSNNCVALREIEVYIDNQKTDYNLDTFGVSSLFNLYMKDGDIKQNPQVLFSPVLSYAIIDLGEEISLERLEVIIYAFNDDNKADGFTITATDIFPDFQIENAIASKNFSYQRRATNYYDNEILFFSITPDIIKNYKYEDDFLATEEELAFPYILENETNLYKRIDTFKHYFILEREYNAEYFKDLEGYIKDDESAIMFYRYQNIPPNNLNDSDMDIINQEVIEISNVIEEEIFETKTNNNNNNVIVNESFNNKDYAMKKKIMKKAIGKNQKENDNLKTNKQSIMTSWISFILTIIIYVMVLINKKKN